MTNLPVDLSTIKFEVKPFYDDNDTTIIELKKKAKTIDWSAEYSDDGSVYRAAKVAIESLVTEFKGKGVDPEILHFVLKEVAPTYTSMVPSFYTIKTKL